VDTHLHPPRLIIGVGNEYRSDDALGLLVARAVGRRAGHAVVVREMSGEGTALMDVWAGEECVCLIDAVRSGAPPGTIHRVCVNETRIPAWFVSSHVFGVAEAVELSRELGTLPQKMVIFGIEVAETRAGSGLSDRVLRSVPELVQMIEHELGIGVEAA
jgi:hydrogenase maturation protease